MFDPRERRITIKLGRERHSVAAISDEEIAAALSSVNLKIVGQQTQEDIRSYILSESSLFLSPEYLTLVTCGKATLFELLAMIQEVLKNVEITQILLERRTWPRDFGPVIDELSELAPRLSAAGFSLAPCPQSGAIDLLRAQRTSGPQNSAGKNIRVLLREPRTLEAPGAESDLASQFFESIFGEYSLHEHRFLPQGYSANAISPSGFGCIHVSPGRPTYASVDVLLFESGMMPQVETFMRIFSPLEARLIMEYAGEFQERRAVADTAVVSDLSFERQVEP